jgi:hypothetical protein
MNLQNCYRKAHPNGKPAADFSECTAGALERARLWTTLQASATAKRRWSCKLTAAS